MLDRIIVEKEAQQKVVPEGFVYPDAQRRALFLREKSEKGGLSAQEEEELRTLTHRIDVYLKEGNRIKGSLLGSRPEKNYFRVRSEGSFESRGRRGIARCSFRA